MSASKPYIYNFSFFEKFVFLIYFLNLNKIYNIDRKIHTIGKSGINPIVKMCHILFELSYEVCTKM